MKEFRSMGAFAEHLARLGAIGGEVTHHIADKSGEEIQKTAQGMIGEYQHAVGPYPAWAELADSTQAERARLGYSENDPGYRSGKMQRSIERKTINAETVVGSDDQDLVYFEMGTARQPPRSVLGGAAIHSAERIRKLAGKTLHAWVAGMGWRRPRITSGD